MNNELNQDFDFLICVCTELDKEDEQDRLRCAIFTLQLEDAEYSLVYGATEQGQRDFFFRDNGQLSIGDSTGGQWDSSWAYSNEDESFSDEVDASSWSSDDQTALNKLHEIKWTFMQKGGNPSNGELVLKQNFLEAFDDIQQESKEGFMCYFSPGFDDEKLTLFSGKWDLSISWA
jgi:hypothetical protein